MKWINLAERQPKVEGSWGHLFWKLKTTDTPFHIKEIDGTHITNMGGFAYPYSDVEWLDESEDIVNGLNKYQNSANTWFTFVLLPFLSQKGVRLDDELRNIWDILINQNLKA